MSSVSINEAHRFGIMGSDTVKHMLFSLGISHEKLSHKMFNSDITNYYSEVSRRFIVFRASLNDTVTLRPEVAAVVADLPATCCTDPADQQAWFDFFQKYGTHYVSEVSFGGQMKMYTFVQSTVRSDDVITEADWNFNVGAQFMNNSGIGFSFANEHQQESFNKFGDYTFDQHFISIGGDQSVTVYDQWLKTVQASPAPIQTTVKPLSELLAPAGLSSTFEDAFSAYLMYCPHTDEGVCNGLGVCDWTTQTCNCDDGTTADADGNCYPLCLDNCNGHGTCTKGVCTCYVDSYGIGYSGPTCATKCGSHTFDAGPGYCWGKHDGEGLLDPCIPPHTCDNLAGATCWCRGFGYDNDMVASYAPSLKGTESYKCGGTGYRCHAWGVGYCSCHQIITCTYGAGGACPTNAKRALTKHMPPLWANNRTHPSPEGVRLVYGTPRT
eukprot:Hpha_TRINITY_DN15990_c0_g8::TRINITY_DN15990_c0_g8_i1::g.74369::m.74369